MTLRPKSLATVAAVTLSISASSALAAGTGTTVGGDITELGTDDGRGDDGDAGKWGLLGLLGLAGLMGLKRRDDDDRRTGTGTTTNRM